MYYNASRKLILKGVDGIAFVADSQIERMEANVEAMQNLYDNMAQYGYDLTKIPFIISGTCPTRRPSGTCRPSSTPAGRWKTRPGKNRCLTRPTPASSW